MQTKRFVVPVLVILLGVTWLLNVLQVLPGVDWIWTAGLAAVGVLTLVVGGLNKLTVVVGPFFIVASICSVLRQTGVLELNIQVPVLIVVLGALMLIAQFLKLPASELLASDEARRKG